MYLGNLEHFQCDLCGATAAVPLFPDGWIWFKKVAGGAVCHACGDCKAQVPEEDRKAAGQLT